MLENPPAVRSSSSRVSSPGREPNSHLSASEPPKVRHRHPAEEPFTPKHTYGHLRLHHQNGPSLSTEDGSPFVLKDLYTHTIIFGESGSGKTYYVLNQLFRELFRSTHLSDGPEREAKKFGGLVIEAKGDFTPKAWSLALQFGRQNDLLFFGPDHLDQSYNMFGDQTESPQQLADKMMQLLTAFGGGKKSEDPFWDNSARKLFTHLFLLHRALLPRPDGETPPMSFELLNLFLMDRGQLKNQNELEADRAAWDRTYHQFLEKIGLIRSITVRAGVTAQLLESQMQGLERCIQIERRELDILVDQHLQENSPDFLPWQEELSRRQWALNERRTQLGILRTLLHCVDADQSDRPLAVRLHALQSQAQGLLNAADDQQRGEHYRSLEEEAVSLQEFVQPRLFHLTPVEPEAHYRSDPATQLRDDLLLLFDTLHEGLNLGEKILGWNPPEPKIGYLRQQLQHYAEELEKEGKDPHLDSIFAYFQEEYLNLANDKTSGSVSMVASNLVTLFVHPPFNHIFSSRGTFSMAQLIDQGQLLVLDMPIALYGATSIVAALALKIDFFRTVLSRHRLMVEDLSPAGPSFLRPINQERPLTYFCDEFASVASTGETTGEAGFLDKVREYKCGCILGLQSIPMLLKKFSEAEIEAILTNCGNKIFLRNSDPRTNEMATKVFGSYYRVNLNRGHTAIEMALNPDQPIGKEGFTVSYSSGNRVDSGEFSKLPDGVAYVKLNPRFGKNQILKLSLVGCPLTSPDPENRFPVPRQKEPNTDQARG